MANLQNILANIPDNLPAELLQIILNAPSIRIERIVSRGHSSPEGFWYDQADHEWVLLLQGAARMQFEGEKSFDLNGGSFVNIPAHKRHRVAWTDPAQTTIWLAIYYGGAVAADALSGREGL
jgi:cupin 2 domain-containing protein